MILCLKKSHLHELFVITGRLDDVSSVDIKMIKNHVLSNWTLNNRVSDNDFKYEHDYSKSSISSTHSMVTGLY